MSGAAPLRRRVDVSPWLGLGIVLTLVTIPELAQLARYPYVVAVADRAAIMAGAAVSLQFLIGTAGLVSLGHAAFLGIGAYCALAFAAAGLNAAQYSLPAAIVGSAAFALATGTLALRTRGVTFIMITLAFAQMAYFIAQSLEILGGDDGSSLPRPAPFTGPLGSQWLHESIVILLAMLIWGARVLDASRFGRVLRTGRESEARVIAAGFNLARVRLAAYAISAAAAGACGWLLALHAGFVSPAISEWRVSGELLVMVILGGVRTPEGAALGAIGLVAAEEALSTATEHWRLLLAPVLIAVALARARQWLPRLR